jgi:3-methyladenine DNA glycosylase/8-oxoguanine DNA glycosylase
LEKLPSEGQVRGMAEAWRPHRSLATAYLYSSLWADRAPARAATRRHPGS